MKLAVIPSNQHKNQYVGMPKGVTEETVCVQMARAFRYECERQGHECQVFWVAGQGEKNTDELTKMLAQAKAWRPDLIVSLHSDAGSARVRDIYPLIGGSQDRSWAMKVATNMANRVGFAVQGATVRSELLFFSSTVGFRRVLLEVGNHDYPENAAFNVRYADFLGVMAARAVLEVEGKLASDGPVACDVPPGQERWKQVVQKDTRPSRSGYFQGDEQGDFKWDQALTRWQADTVLSRVKADLDELRRGMAALVERVEALESPGK